ncbi:MAG: glutaredoxin 3 [Deltaproteobacteria bacterium]|nr:glutaredoxin 3 [Deltaproteobacteria bacterium]
MAKVIVYTKNYCSYCDAAKALLRAKGVDFEEIDVIDDELLQEESRKMSGRSTVPQIFIDGEPVGGYQELKQLDAQGELDRLVGLSA